MTARVRTRKSAFHSEAIARYTLIISAFERVNSGRRQSGQWFCVLALMFTRQSGQMRWVHGRIFGGTEEDQQTMQVGSSASSSSSSSPNAGSLDGRVVVLCTFALERLFMNLLKLGRPLPAFDAVSGNLLQVKANAVKAKASAHCFFQTKEQVSPSAAPYLLQQRAEPSV